MPIDEWRIAAETDDALVAELLLTIKHSGETWTATPTRTSVKPAVASAGDGLLPFRWGRRRARSMPGVTRFVKDKVYKERATRSPTTPLSWSGTSVSASGNGDGYEASSMMCQRSTSSRSKFTAAYDLANSKRAKRKKTYNELKEEECSLLQERRNLKMDLATLRSTLTDQKMTNQNLKKTIKSRRMTTLASGDPFAGCSTQTVTTSMIQVPYTVQETNNEIPDPCFSFNSSPSPEGTDKKPFMLPDLNMPPSTD